jgi:hypothetical protein
MRCSAAGAGGGGGQQAEATAVQRQANGGRAAQHKQRRTARAAALASGWAREFSAVRKIIGLSLNGASAGNKCRFWDFAFRTDTIGPHPPLAKRTFVEMGRLPRRSPVSDVASHTGRTMENQGRPALHYARVPASGTWTAKNQVVPVGARARPRNASTEIVIYPKIACSALLVSIVEISQFGVQTKAKTSCLAASTTHTGTRYIPYDTQHLKIG